MAGDWFDAWQVSPSGIGGDHMSLVCPKANSERPNRTPDCFIELDPQAENTIAHLREIAAKHRKAHR